MRRKLFTLCSAASLLLCAAVCVLWVRSYFAFDEANLIGVPGEQAFAVFSSRGHLLLVWNTSRGGFVSHGFSHNARPTYLYQAAVPAPTWPGERAVVDLFGWGLGIRILETGDLLVRQLRMPCWAAVALLAVGPAVWVGRRLRSRPPPGRCPACGYDLRATPDRCPECGTAGKVPT